ncbi:MAG: MFS transporter [Bryobacteraceae bacterium]
MVRITQTHLYSPAIRHAWWSIAAIFLIHGLVFSTWVSRIPAVQHQLRLNNGVLGLTLLGAACGCVLATPLCGWLLGRYGSKRVTAWSTLGFCIALIPISFASNAVALAAALLVFGGFAGTMDVAMNAQAIEVEKALGRPSMSRFHAMFSLGGMAGSGVGGALAARGVTPSNHFVAAALLLIIASFLTAPHMLVSHSRLVPKGQRLPLSQIPTELFAISAIAFCMLLSEGAMADWTAVYLRQGLAAGPGAAATGYAVFSAAMATFRLLGDAITLRLGSPRTVRTGSLLAAAGVVWVLLAPSAKWAHPGFAVAGAGFSAIVPLAFGAGGRITKVSPGAGIATITGLGYIGFLVGPPLIGFTAQMLTLRYALGIVVLVCLVSAGLAGWLKDSVREQAPA